MEEITFACQECGKDITMPGERRGHVEVCPHCDAYVDVPYEMPGALGEESKAAASTAMLDPVGRFKGPGSNSRSKTQLWMEVAAVLCLAYLPWQFFALLDFMGWYKPSRLPFVKQEIYYIIEAIQISIPLLLIISLTGDRWSDFGIVRPRWFMDAASGCLICFFCWLTHHFAWIVLPLSMLEGSTSPLVVLKTRPDGIFEFFLLAIGVAASGFSQEFIMRGYLIPRFERLLGSTVKAVLITSVLFGGYHIYQGIAAVIGDVAIGLVYAIAFCLLRRLWPLCLAHALMNFLISLPLR
jgi:membrane protease YdiL (CAAX protease family)